MQWAKQTTVSSVCELDESVWHNEQKGTVDDHGVPWLPPLTFLSMVIQLHKDQLGQVMLNSDFSWSFPIVNGVKQGWVIASTLFSVFFSMMLKKVTEDPDDDGIVYIGFRLDGSLFNVRGLHAHTYKKTWAAVPWSPPRRRRCPRCSHWKSPAAPNFLLCRGCPTIWTWGQPEEDWGSSPACTPRRVPPSPHHHRWNWVEWSTSVHLSEVYHHFRCQDRQRSR